MKRLWAAAAILAVLLGGTLWNAWYAERLTGGMIQQLKQAQERTAQGDWEGAAELSEQAFQSWQDHEAYLHILMRHSDTDEILSSFRALEQYLALEETDQYTAANAELMTQQAQNALLKTLEEPPEYVVFLLLTENAEALLPTINSRCVMLKLRNIRNTLIRKYLMEVLQVPDYKADMCTAFAQGNLGRAIMLANSEHFNEIREEAVQLLKYIHEMEISEIAQAVSRITTYKLEITDYLDIIMIWYRDVLLYKATKEVDKVIFKEQISYIKEQAKKSSYEGIETILKALDTAKARLRANVNFDLVMELLCLTIKEN